MARRARRRAEGVRGQGARPEEAEGTTQKRHPRSQATRGDAGGGAGDEADSYTITFAAAKTSTLRLCECGRFGCANRDDSRMYLGADPGSPASDLHREPALEKLN